MSVEKLGELQAALEASKASYEALQQTSQSQASTFAEKFAAMEAELEAAKAALATVAQEKVEAKASARLAKLTTAFGSEKAATLSSAFALLDDASFELATSSFQAKQDTEDTVVETQKSAAGEPVVTEAAVPYEAAVKDNLMAQIAKAYPKQ